MKNWNRVRPEIKIHPKIQEFQHLSGHLYMDNTDKYLLKYCQKELEIKSFIDIGCGLGRQVELGVNLCFCSKCRRGTARASSCKLSK